MSYRTLEDVGGQLRSFLDKWGSQRPPDRAQDNEAVLSLFDDLQEAVYHYRVWPQPKVYTVLTMITGCAANND